MKGEGRGELPFVSVIIPCRNEKALIKKCLLSIVRNDYPHSKLELLVVDGMSEDGTRKIIDVYTKRYLFISRIDNYKETIPCAMNLGITHAKGNIIMKMDAHSTYRKGYITKCVHYLQTYNADNVGGVLVARSGDLTLQAKSIALSLSHTFGVGDSPFRKKITSLKPRMVDTAAFGCYKREVFEKIGRYNENLARSSDIELNLRLKKAGGKIILFPDILAYYHSDPTFWAFLKHNVRDGIWAIYSYKFTNVVFRPRHFAPFAFVSLLLICTLAALFARSFLRLLISVLGIYLILSLLVSLTIAIRKRNLRYTFLIPVAFAIRHFGYGMGSLWGFIKLVIP